MADTMGTLEELGDTMIGQLYDIVCGGDGNVATTGDAFLTWCQPGLPLPADENSFALARLVDFVPGVGAAYTRDRRLSTVYGDILRRCRVVHDELTPDQRQKIEKYRDLLRSTKRVTEDGPMLKAYNEKLAAYLAAVLEYNTRRVRNGAVEPCLAAQVRAAMDVWIRGGYRDEVDQINAYIEQITSRDLVLWRQSLLELFEDGLTGAAVDDQRCYHTTLVPANFAASAGWSRYELSNDTGGHQARGSWKAGGGLTFGLSSVAGQSARFGGRFAPAAFTVSFELRQVLISRPWFYPEFLGHRGWAFDEQLCDGGDPPEGSLVGYPTALLLARDVRIESAEFAGAVRDYTAEVGRQASVGWGPLLLGSGAVIDARGVSVPGMQIVGFVNRLLGRTPNPLPDLDPERLV